MRRISSIILISALLVQFGCTPKDTEQITPIKAQQSLEWEHNDYQIGENDLPAPLLPNPIYGCSSVIKVRGLIEGALVEIYDKNDNLLGSATANGSTSDVTLFQPIDAGEIIYARQTWNSGNIISPESIQRTVIEFNGTMPTPRIGYDITDCAYYGRVFGLVPGSKVTFTRKSGGTNYAYGHRDQPGKEANVHIPGRVQNAHVGDDVFAMQFFCQGEENEIASDPSDDITIINAPTPTPQPTIVSAKVNERWVSYDNMFIGSKMEIADSSSTILQTIYPQFTTDAGAPLPSPLTAAQNPLQVRATLCSTTPYSSYTAPTLSSVPAPTIIEPVCPNDKFVLVDTGPHAGRIVIDDDQDNSNGFVGIADNSFFNDTPVGIKDSINLSSNMTLYAQHLLPSGLDSPYSSSVTVGGSDTLTILSAKDYVDQNTGAAVSGFVTETSRGPVFVVKECCSNEPDTNKMKVTIKKKGAQVAEVKLVEQFPGYYVGQWDWFIDGAEGLPATPGADYTAEVETPCNSTTITESFNVFQGEVDTNDGSAPIAKLTVKKMDGTTLASVQTSNSNQTAMVTPGEELDVLAQAEDGDGIQEVKVIVSGGSLTGTTTKTALPEPPVPHQLDVNAVLSSLQPYDSAVLTVDAKNFANTVSTSPSVTVTATHPTPVITDIQPGTSFLYDTTTAGDDTTKSITITGEHLYYANLTTEVIFEYDGSEVDKVTVGSGSTDQIDVDLPLTLSGNFGDITVRVQTVSPANANTKTSNSDKFELEGRTKGVFKKFTMFATTAGTYDCTNNTSDINAIDSVELIINNTSGNFNIKINKNDGNITYESNIDGFIMDPDNCRTVALLAYTPAGGGTINSSISSFYYIPNLSGNRKNTWPHPNLPNVNSVQFSKDGTIVNINNLNSSNEFEAFAYDMLRDEWIDSKPSTCFNNCTFTAEVINERKVVVKESSNTVINKNINF